MLRIEIILLADIFHEVLTRHDPRARPTVVNVATQGGKYPRNFVVPGRIAAR
jgi:hypothetical protein